MAQQDGKKNIIIIGGGIIGCTTAYYLTRHPSFDPLRHKITLLEASKIAGGASGKAGGLLGLWAYPANIVPLSYRLHAELAKEHGGEQRWGYRRIYVGQLDARVKTHIGDQHGGKMNGAAGKADDKESVSLKKRTPQALGLLRAAGVPADLDWVDAESVTSYDEMGGPDTTAQVHPYQFTTSMASLAEEAGVKIILGARVTSINPSPSSAAGSIPSITSVTYTSTEDTLSTTLSATHCVLAAGPWTSTLLPSARISGLRAHSVTICPSRPVSPYCLFTSITLPPTDPTSKNRKHGASTLTQTVTPEIYARPNNEVYACGEGDRLVPLPSTTADVVTDDTRCADIIDHVGAISAELRDGEVTVRQACYLPVCEGDNGPWIGEVGAMRGLVLASGHSCWGIQNGPGTGKLVAEILMEGKAKSAKLGVLDPKRGGM